MFSQGVRLDCTLSVFSVKCILITADKDVNNKAMLVQDFPEHSQVPLNCDTPWTHVHSCRKGANVNSKTSSSKMTLLANHQHQVVKKTPLLTCE